MTVESLTESLTEVQWQIAHAIAQTLVKDETDVNELGKAIAYLRTCVHYENGGSRFFDYLKTLVRNGRQIGHSARTSDYYRSIDKACSQYLHSEQANAHTILQILGWVARLMRYYKDTVPIGEIATPSQTSAAQTLTSLVKSPRQIEIETVTQSQKFQVGQILEAEVTNIKGKEVTYTILEKIKLTVKEPKKYETLSVGTTIKVEVTDIKEDGSPKKVKSVE